MDKVNSKYDTQLVRFSSVRIMMSNTISQLDLNQYTIKSDDDLFADYMVRA